jgi:hypothetical protein
MTQSELSQRALLLLAAGDPNSPWLKMETEAGLAQEQALQELGMVVADHPAQFGLLQQTYSITLTSGVGQLTTATGVTTSAVDMIWTSVQRGHVKDEMGTRLIYVPDRANFEGYQLPGLLYYTTYTGNIYTRSATSGDYASDQYGVTGPLNVFANYYPTVGGLASIAPELDSDLVRILARTLTEKYAPGMPVAAEK